MNRYLGMNMPLREYQCRFCGDTKYVFESEEKEKLEPESCEQWPYDHDYVKMPPSITVIHATDTWMSETHIDSFQTTYELDRELNIEAQNDREMKLINEARKNL